MSTLILSIISGLIGACIAAYFNYRIRLSLFEKENKEKEKRIAYVYVVHLSQYSAIHIWIKSFLEKIVAELEPPIPEGEFNIGHVASVFIEDAILSVDEDFFEKADPIEKLIDQLMENFSNNYLTNEEQAKLPKQTIIYYQRYEYYLKTTANGFKFLKVALTNKEVSKIIEAQQINSLIETVESLFDSASVLKAAMAQFGGIGVQESKYLLEQQYEFFNKSFGKAFESEAKLKKAREFLEKVGVLSANKSSKHDPVTGAPS